MEIRKMVSCELGKEIKKDVFRLVTSVGVSFFFLCPTLATRRKTSFFTWLIVTHNSFTRLALRSREILNTSDIWQKWSKFWIRWLFNLPIMYPTSETVSPKKLDLWTNYGKCSYRESVILFPRVSWEIIFFHDDYFFSGIEILKSYYHFPSAENGFYHVHLTHKAVWPHGSF